MKGVLFLHLRAFIEQTYPRARWDKTLSECGIAQMFSPGWDYPDRMLFSVAETFCRSEGVLKEEFWYRFGAHSMGEFRRHYHWYFDQKPDARAFFLSVDAIHVDAVKDMTGAHPPRFSMQVSEDGNEITMAYRSERGMVDYLRGAIDGILAIYGETAAVQLEHREDSGATFRIRFT